jgi:hypothetical protein
MEVNSLEDKKGIVQVLRLGSQQSFQSLTIMAHTAYGLFKYVTE